MRMLRKLSWCAALVCAALASGPSSAQWPSSWDIQSPIRQMAILNVPNQVLSGGATVVSQCATGLGPGATAAQCTPASSATVTINCGLAPSQYLQDNAAFTLAAPTNDGSCFIFLINGASAGTVTLSGFTVGSSTGAALDTTSGHKFTISVWRVTIPGTGSTSGYTIFAHQ